MGLAKIDTRNFVKEILNIKIDKRSGQSQKFGNVKLRHESKFRREKNLSN